MKKVLSGLLVAGLMLTGCGGGSTTKKKSDVKISVIQYMQHDALDATLKGFKEELAKNGYNKDKIVVKNASGDASNCETIAEQLVNSNPDLIYAIATPAAQAVAKKTQDIPVVVSAVTDPASAKLVKSNKKPGTNVTGASDLTPVADQMKLLKQLLPNAKNVAIMYTGSEANSEFQADMAVKEAKKNGLTPIRKTVSDSNDIQSVAQSIKADAVYIPTDNLLAANIPAVTQILDEAGIPLICGEKGMVEAGGLATYGIDYTNLGKMAGKMAVKILSGKGKPATMPIEYQSAKDSKLTINSEKVEKLKVTVPDSLKAKAEFVTTKK